MNVLNVTELNPLKWVILGHVNVISTKRRPEENMEGGFWPTGHSLQPPVEAFANVSPLLETAFPFHLVTSYSSLSSGSLS